MTDTALEAIGANLEDLALFLDGATEIVETFEVEECVELRARLDDLATQTRAAVTSVDHRLLTLLDVGQSCSTPNGQVVVEARGKQRTYGTRLALRLAARVADTPADADGQMLPPAVLTAKTAEELVAVFALDNASATFRSTELKSRGLRAGEFRSYEDGSPRIRFMR